MLSQLRFIIIICIGVTLSTAQDNIFTFSPNQSYCIGEEVILTCYVYPTAEDYTPFAFLSFNGSEPHFINDINGNTASTGYIATGAIPIMGNSARIELTIASFQVADSNTLFGCHAQFSDNGTVTEALESGYPPIADPVSRLEGTHTITILTDCYIQTVFNVTNIISNRLTGLTYTFELSDNTDSILQLITQETDSLTPNVTFSVTFKPDVCYKLSVSVKNCANIGDGPSAEPVYFSLQGVRTNTGEFVTSTTTNTSRVEWIYKTDPSCFNNYTGDFLTEDLFWFLLIDKSSNTTDNISGLELFLPQRFEFHIPKSYDLSTNNFALRIRLCNQYLTDQEYGIQYITYDIRF